MEIEICSENLTSIKDISILFNTDDHEFYGEPGKEHYRLLSYLASCFKNSDIFDIGTHRGASALALSYEPTNTVYSFDIENRKKIYENKPHNVNFVISNLFEKEGEEWNQKLLKLHFLFFNRNFKS
jgi:methylase of polypeptide subunit release factors